MSLNLTKDQAVHDPRRIYDAMRNTKIFFLVRTLFFLYQSKKNSMRPTGKSLSTVRTHIAMPNVDPDAAKRRLFFFFMAIRKRSNAPCRRTVKRVSVKI